MGTNDALPLYSGVLFNSESVSLLHDNPFHCPIFTLGNGNKIGTL
jgi:hypothetical protein